MPDCDTIDDSRLPRQVQSVYDEIADHFSKTRAYPWPEVEEFLDGLDGLDGFDDLGDLDGRIGLDVGCGNGRHMEPLAETVDRAIGVDLSRELLHEASARLAGLTDTSLLQADAAALPLASGSVDVAIYVATLHHLPNRAVRVDSLSELARVLDGAALVSAWSTAHDRFDADPDDETGFDTTIDWTLPGGETIPRFYHIYAPAEFERDLAESGLTVERTFVSSGNCYADVRA